MPISESMVQDIVQEVMAKMQIADAPTGKHGIFKDMNDAIDAAKKSELIVKKMSMDQREKIITCIRKKIKENAEVMARMGVDETGMGNVGDKILKHHLVADKTPGTEDITTTAWSGDRGLTLIEMGPFGVIGAITPCTNPSETILCNTMGMLAGGNTVVFNPHPAAIKTSIFAINLVNEASLEAGGPDNIAVTVEKPTLETSNIMMKHKDIPLIAATGGPGVVIKCTSVYDVLCCFTDNSCFINNCRWVSCTSSDSSLAGGKNCCNNARTACCCDKRDIFMFHHDVACL